MYTLLSTKEQKDFLDEKVEKYNNSFFIESDPIQVPHLFSKKQDIEIAALYTSTIAWGNRKAIINNAKLLFQLMDNSPHDFVLNFEKSDLNQIEKFKHRTFNGQDVIYFLNSLKHIYSINNSLEHLFNFNTSLNGLENNIASFRNHFFSLPHVARIEKHIGNPLKNSTAKRICMFLRWMIRKDNKKVDFGIWNASSSFLMCPLDIHSGRVARKLGLLNRKQNDWKAVVELTNNLKQFDKNDPVKYDFALFGLGVFENF